MTDDCEASTPRPTALDRLERGLTAAAKTMTLTAVSGVVTEIAMSHYRVAGLSRFLRLGECVRVDVGDRSQLGEVVRIDDATVTLKPFDARCDAAIGARAYRAEAFRSPPAWWKGRAIDALGQPIDGAASAGGDRVMPIDSEPPPALGDAAAKADQLGHPRRRLLHAAVRRTAHRHLRRIGRRQVDDAGDARPSARFRHRGDRAGRRTRPRGARIPRRLARRQSPIRDRRRLDRRRKPDDAPPRAAHGDGGRRVFPRPRRPGAADRRLR